MVIDTLFLIASAALGWGLSLATYRLFATRNGWPMGEVHRETPALPVMLGLFATVVAFLFAAARGIDTGGWAIPILGIMLAIFWTGFLGVTSQVSLFLAPAAAVLLVLGWASARGPGDSDSLLRQTYIDPRGTVIVDEKGRVETLPRVKDGARVVVPVR
jgi:hypothetical protein